MAYSDILYEKANGIARITINRPSRLNAIRIETYEELTAALWVAASDDAVRIVVLTGAGEQAFSTGGDVEMAQTVLTTEHAARMHMWRVTRVSEPILRMDKPVLCAVNGLACGSGVEIMMFCDLAIASETATFNFSATDNGYCIGWGVPQLLPLQVGFRRAEELLFLSKRISADQAAEIGLITRAIPKSKFAAEVDYLCRRILEMPTT
jgi:enoyl-CoA hydratase/carnithine racemase